MAYRYLNGKIYTIRSYLTDDIYIGSTCLPLHKRLYAHRKNHKHFIETGKKYITSIEILRHDDHYIELLDLFPCGSKAELERKEGAYIRCMPCVNKVVAGRTIKEWIEDNKETISEKAKIYREKNKEYLTVKNIIYREENKDAIIAQQKHYREENREHRIIIKRLHYENNKERLCKEKKEYREQNKEILSAKGKIKVTCECGSFITHDHMARHKRTVKHCHFVASLLPIESPEEENPAL